MASTAKNGIGVLKQTFQEFSEDDCPRMAAALAYYTIFSLPPLLVIIIAVAGMVLDPQQVQQTIQQQMGNLIGPDAADQVQAMIENAKQRGTGGTMAVVLGIAGLLFGATGAFAQLQRALNAAWNVEPAPEQGGVKNFLMKRVLSFGMILGIAFLLLVSLALSTLISVFTSALADYLPEGLSGAVLWLIDLGVSLSIITLLFAALFKVLPDAKIAWRDVWIGAGVTALLFVLGKFLIGLYLGRSNPGSAFGAAGSLAIILVWVYYSAMILFIGAEFTQVWARRYGTRIEPAEGAVRVREKKGSVASDQTTSSEAPQG